MAKCVVKKKKAGRQLSQTIAKYFVPCYASSQTEMAIIYTSFRMAWKSRI
jgi:hypothetical protein